jgi:serine/threonine protein kinase
VEQLAAVTQIQVEPAQELGTRFCRGCGREVEGRRCDGCGVAHAPGGFRVQRVLSTTGHGRVYLATSPSGERVALKELVFHLAPDVKAVDDFERENGLLARLQHPQIPRFVGGFCEGEGVHLRLYQAQEFVEGRSLAAEVEEGPLGDAQVRDVASQLFAVLGHLHSRNPPILHRDVKPANLVRRPEGQIVLVDFGAARDLTRGVTHGATLVGTFGYMAPEQLGGTSSVASDFYGAGATLLHLLSGSPPDRRPEDPLRVQISGKVPQHWEAFLSKLLAVRAGDRFASAEEALAALARLRERPQVRSAFPRQFLAASLSAVLASSVALYSQHKRTEAAVNAQSAKLSGSQASRGAFARNETLFRALVQAQSQEEKEAALRELAATVLEPGEINPEREYLTVLLLQSARSQHVRAAAAALLQSWPVPDSLVIEATLHVAQQDPVPEVRVAAVRAAGALLHRAPAAEMTEARGEQLMKLALTDNDAEVRAGAAAALRGVPTPPTTQAQALQMVTEGGTALRRQGLRALAHQPPSEESVRALANALGEEQTPVVRQDALNLLASSGPLGQAALPAIRRALRDIDPGVREAAVVALVRVEPNQEQLKRELKELLHSETDPGVRRALALASGAHP